MFKKLALFFALTACSLIWAQQDSIFHLREVVLTDSQLKNFSDTQNTSQLNDSVIQKNQASLTALLRYNSVIYFKENGNGMVSSPSFRGTTAQQTAVIWNGININSQLNGQTDFNTLSTRDFNSITVRAGGGSVIYGSGAVGGTIHLNNDVSFKDQFINKLQLNYGSFSTFGANYTLDVATDKISVNASISHNQSENDYEYIGFDKKNENGQYENTSFNSHIGYRINRNNEIKFFSYLFDGSRNFSGTIASPSKSNYLDFNTRNLLEWTNYSGLFTSKTKVAYLTEEYKYFENKALENFSTGNANTFIAKYDLLYNWTSKIKVNSIIDYTQNSGSGSSLSNNKREIGSFSLLFKHQINDKLSYEASLRKEITSNYKSPLLYSLGGNIQLSNWYAIKFSGSKNFRIPTFNDLYWQGSGNLNLKPESALQAEMGQVFTYKKASLTTTAFYSKITDMLRWLPNASGLWQPINTDNVSIYGLEALFHWNKNFTNSSLQINGTYAYTVSENDDTNKQLIYVPFHKATSSIAFQYKRTTFTYQNLFNGVVFTSSDNSYELKEYLVSNVSLDYKIGAKKPLNLGFQILNLENKPYQNVLSRPMPGRNYMMNLTFNF
ncbi:TonB-dependent receptor [uncultured Flavobacterium sp.]|mgnify:CR=1 FL=1|uniref:TonB-dependent receptor plug domain-containing protein n=1 Tax=uncultured Flavobacterium sp. TaxID=165435 RepID=UPI0030ECD23B|tara:strand:- start:37432 stop:39258 length:1827 start_codon:yes stop_codon:yes gene_type:complete